MSQDRWDYWRKLFDLEKDPFFEANASLFNGAPNSLQAQYLQKVNPLTGEYFTASDIFKMQHIPLALKEIMLPILSKSPSVSELMDAFESTDLMVTESLELESKAVIAPSGAKCVVFSYNFFQFIRNLAQILMLSWIQDPRDVLISDRLLDLVRMTEDNFNPVTAAIALKHNLIADYRSKRFQKSLPFSFRDDKIQKMVIAMTHALELFFVGHELAHFKIGHIESYSRYRSYRTEVPDDLFQLGSRHLNKGGEFDADWDGFLFAAHFTDELFTREERFRSNDLVLDLIWHFFAFLMQVGDTGSDAYPAPVDRAHVLFLRVWGNQADIPQLHSRAQLIRSLYTAGIGLAEIKFGRDVR